MGLFGLFGGKGKLPEVVAETAGAMRPQIEAARRFYSSSAAFHGQLASEGTAAFLHGFVLFFAVKHGLRAPELIWAATIQTFDRVFGSHLSASIVASLQRALREGTAEHWITERSGAARYFDRERIELLTSFLEGGAS